MKHNPRLNEKMARLPGFADIHPLQPRLDRAGRARADGRAGALAEDADRHAGRRAVAQGRRARRAVRHDGDQGRARGARRQAPRSRAGAESRPRHQPGDRRAARLLASRSCRRATTARVDLAEVQGKLGPTSRRIMLTNPNTCGLFERDIIEIAEAVHEAGAYFYCDGANFNAIVGRVRPGDLGIDAMHINLHKTFSTPHGGGGPGAGPVVLSAALAPFAPVPLWCVPTNGGSRAGRARGRREDGDEPFGRMMRLPRPDGHVRARAHLHAEPRRRRPAAGRRGRGAQRQLHPGRACRT